MIFVSCKNTDSVSNARIKLSVIKFDSYERITKLCQDPILDFLNRVYLLVQPGVIRIYLYFWLI